MKIQSYRDLIVWQRAIELVTEIYHLTKKLPKNEDYGIVSQMRRAAISIPSNIAEGYRRKNRKEYLQFLYIAFGSASELETQLIICEKIYSDIEYIKANSLLNETIKMLSSIINKLS
jgi:four helix bundle protein